MKKSKTMPKERNTENSIYLKIYTECEDSESNDIERFNKGDVLEMDNYKWQCLDYCENIDDEKIDLIEKFLAFQI